MNDFGFPYKERALTCEVDIGLVIEHLYLCTCPELCLGGTNLISTPLRLVTSSVINQLSTTFFKFFILGLNYFLPFQAFSYKVGLCDCLLENLAESNVILFRWLTYHDLSFQTEM